MLFIPEFIPTGVLEVGLLANAVAGAGVLKYNHDLQSTLYILSTYHLRSKCTRHTLKITKRIKL